MIADAFIADLQIHRTSTYALSGLTRRAIPRSASTKRPMAHGSFDVSEFYEGSLYTLNGYVRGDTPSEAASALAEIRAAFALTGGSTLLRYTYQGDADGYQAEVRQRGEFEAPLSGAAPLVAWAVDVFAADPREYGQTVRSASTDPTLAGASGGLSFPLSFPLVFGTSTPGLMTVVNDGTFATPPVYTISGPAVDPVITNETTGDAITTSGLTLASGQVATIDVAARDLVLLGTSRPDLINPTLTRWSDIPRGTSVLRMTGSGFTAGESLLTVTYRDARI